MTATVRHIGECSECGKMLSLMPGGRWTWPHVCGLKRRHQALAVGQPPFETLPAEEVFEAARKLTPEQVGVPDERKRDP